MPKFPVDAPKAKVIKALEILGFRLIREAIKLPWNDKIPMAHALP